jgi:putative glutathione S-transferase
MGLLIDGKWHDRWYDTKESGGRFVRSEAPFRNWVTADGRPGPSGEGGFAAEPGRYHLYVSLACPWAHRTLIFRKLKGLEGMIGVSVVHWHMGEQGWTFEAAPGATGDTLYGSRFLHELYTRAVPGCTGRVTVPVLWDRKRETIVSNESSEIIRMLNAAFDRRERSRATTGRPSSGARSSGSTRGSIPRSTTGSTGRASRRPRRPTRRR